MIYHGTTPIIAVCEGTTPIIGTAIGTETVVLSEANFKTADGHIIKTSDGNTFLVKEAS